MLWLYFILGPLAWLLLFYGTRMGRARMGRLARWQTQLPPEPPHVTILVPAKDEGAGIKRCLERVLGQDYPSFDVIAIDDRSTDETPKLLDELAAGQPRLRVLHVPHGGLPPGWLGKCHALHVGTGAVGAADWLLFVDSDVTLEPGALSAAISIAITRKYDAVSLLTRLETHQFIEELMLPPLAAAWAIMHTISLTNENSRKDVAAANGQFFLIRRTAYEAVGGHAAVRDQITEDVELMRLLKSRDFIVRLFSAPHLAATRMHSTMGQIFNGWARIFSGTSRRRPGRILGGIWFLLTAVFSVYPALAYGIYRGATGGGYDWLGLSLLHYGLMTLYLMLIYRWSGNRARYALLLPVSAAIMLAIYIYSLRKCQTGRITWRGTEFAASATGPAIKDAQ